MYSRLFTLILLLIAFKAAAQRDAAPRDAAQRDLIITQAGEQIRCRIVDESSMRFGYIYVNEKGKPVRTEIFKTLISSFKYNYFPEDLPSGKNTPAAVTKNSGTPPKAEQGTDAQRTIAEVPQRGANTNERIADNAAKSTSAGAERKEASSPVTQKAEEQRSPAGSSASSGKTPPVTGAKENTAQNSSAGAERKETSLPVTQKAEEQRNLTGSNASSGKTPQETAGTKGSPLPGRESEKESEYVSPLKGKTEFTNYLKYRVGFKGGLGNIVDENSDKSAFGLFNEKLRRGWVYGVDAAVFLNDHIGIGLTYQSYQSHNKNSSLDFAKAVGADDYLQIKSLESKVNHKFVGPTLLGRIGMDYKTFIVATVSPGYYFYSDKGIVNQMNYEYKGGAWGGAATLGIDFLIGSNETGRDVILSFECGYNYGQLKSVNPEKSWHELPIRMNRLDFAVGLRFTRFPRYLR